MHSYLIGHIIIQEKHINHIVVTSDIVTIECSVVTGAAVGHRPLSVDLPKTGSNVSKIHTGDMLSRCASRRDWLLDALAPPARFVRRGDLKARRPPADCYYTIHSLELCRKTIQQLIVIYGDFPALQNIPCKLYAMVKCFTFQYI